MKATKFRNSQGIRYTKALFADVIDTDKSNCIYVLEDHHEKPELPSLHRLYIEMEDPTEYLFGETYFENYEHWTMIANAPWMKPYLEKWRKELDLKVRAEALVRIRKESESDESKNSFQANKFLVEKGYVQVDEKDKESKKRGRPSKEEINREAALLVKDENFITDLYKKHIN